MLKRSYDGFQLLNRRTNNHLFSDEEEDIEILQSTQRYNENSHRRTNANAKVYRDVETSESEDEADTLLGIVNGNYNPTLNNSDNRAYRTKKL